MITLPIKFILWPVGFASLKTTASNASSGFIDEETVCQEDLVIYSKSC